MRHKSILLFFLFVGLLLMIIEIMRSMNECKPQKIIYRYVPRSFEEEQNNPVMVSEIFKTMFSQPSPWIDSINSNDDRKKEEINNYFISQA